MLFVSFLLLGLAQFRTNQTTEQRFSYFALKRRRIIRKGGGFFVFSNESEQEENRFLSPLMNTASLSIEVPFQALAQLCQSKALWFCYLQEVLLRAIDSGNPQMVESVAKLAFSP